MSRIAFIPFALAALLAGGQARAQTAAGTTQEKGEAGSPHSVKNKDRAAPSTDTDANKASADAAETGNPHDRKNKDRGHATHGKKASAASQEAAEKENPHSVKNSKHMKHGTPDSAANDRTHGEPGAPANASPDTGKK